MVKLNEETLEKAGLEHYRFFDAIAELPYVEMIYIFGSRARGDYRKWSDIDLAVKYLGNDEFHRKVVNIIVSELADTAHKIDVIDYNSKLSDKFRKSIDEEKVILYEKP